MQILVTRGVVFGEGKDQVLVNRGILVEAETIKDAIAKTEPKQGVEVSLNAKPQPQGLSAAAIQAAIENTAPAEGVTASISVTPRQQMAQPQPAPAGHFMSGPPGSRIPAPAGSRIDVPQAQA
jgi:cytochrome oxidase assembly protein ShyY1